MGTKIYRKYGDFGDRLKKLRKERYKTQDDFAEAVGKKIETVRNWEQGRALPEMETFFKICDLLDCDLDYLTGRLQQKTLISISFMKRRDYQKTLLKSSNPPLTLI